MKLTVKQGGVPVGSYLAEFQGVEPVEADAVRGYKAGLKWLFEVVAGSCKGQKTSRITTDSPTPKNSCGKMLAGLLGRPLTLDEDVDLESLEGQSFFVVVAQTENGGTRVETATPPPQQ